MLVIYSLLLTSVIFNVKVTQAFFNNSHKNGDAGIFEASLTGFILNLENLENLENRPFLQKVKENRNSHGTFYNFCPSQGKFRENEVFSLHIIFIKYLHNCPQSRCSNCCQ